MDPAKGAASGAPCLRSMRDPPPEVCMLPIRGNEMIVALLSLLLLW